MDNQTKENIAPRLRLDMQSVLECQSMPKLPLSMVLTIFDWCRSSTLWAVRSPLRTNSKRSLG